MTECEEPGCTRSATKKWQGRSVCEDHYDSFRDKQDKICEDLDE